MPNVMAAMWNAGGALCWTPQTFTDPYCWSAVHVNAANTRNPLNFAVVPKTRQQISAASEQKFAIFWGHEGRLSCLISFFPIVDIRALVAKI